jgi:hypothetical protein
MEVMSQAPGGFLRDRNAGAPAPFEAGIVSEEDFFLQVGGLTDPAYKQRPCAQDTEARP